MDQFEGDHRLIYESLNCKIQSKNTGTSPYTDYADDNEPNERRKKNNNRIYESVGMISFHIQIGFVA